jgi:hypothetical protein
MVDYDVPERRKRWGNVGGFKWVETNAVNLTVAQSDGYSVNKVPAGCEKQRGG